MASMVREQVSNEGKLAEHFALIVDKTKDVCKKEQISVVLRYLNNDSKKSFWTLFLQMAWMQSLYTSQFNKHWLSVT